MTSTALLSVARNSAQEELYKPAEVAKIIKRSSRTVQRIFRYEPGVVVMNAERPTKSGSKPRTSILIPNSVLEKWKRRHSVPESVIHAGLRRSPNR